MYHDPDPVGSRMRENAQTIICQGYLQMDDERLREIHKRVGKMEIEEYDRHS